MKKALFIAYAWGSTALFAGLIYWLATISYLDTGDQVTTELVKIIFRMSMYAILFILLYRSIILTLKTSVRRLSQWRSKREQIEDTEFVLIIETLVVVLTVLSTTLFSVFEEYTQFITGGYRSAEVKDVLISIISVLLTALVVYTIPVIGELEIAIKNKLSRELKSLKKRS